MREALMDKNLQKFLEYFRLKGRDDHLGSLLEKNEEYKVLVKGRAEASQALRDVLSGKDAIDLFESYSDAVYAQEIFELEAIYEKGIKDGGLNADHNQADR